MKETIQLKDFLDFSYLSNLQDNGKDIAYVVSRCNEKDNSYDQKLHMWKNDQDVTLTQSGKESLYLWEDEHTLLFANMRDPQDQKAVENGEEKTVFYRLDTRGGEAVKAFEIPLTVLDIKMVSTHVFALCVNFDLRYSSMPFETEEIKKKRVREKMEMLDYEVLDELPFYFNGAGYTNKTRRSLFLFEETSGKLKRISLPLFQMDTFIINDDKTKIYFTGVSYAQVQPMKNGLFMYDIKKDSLSTCINTETYSIMHLENWGNDILFAASKQERYGINENPKFYLMHQETWEVSKLYDFDEAIGNTVGSDCRFGKTRSVMVYEDACYFIATILNSSILYRLDKSGNLSTVIEKEGSIDDFTIVNGTIYYIAMHDMRLQELYAYCFKDHSSTRLTGFHDDFYQSKDIRMPEPVTITQGEETIYGWVLTPHDFNPHSYYPAILDIHGGPKTVYGQVYYHEMQVWANMGYVVFFANPRGGDGRGNAFVDIRGKYGTIDYDDLMKFTDTVLEKYPCIDIARLGVTGGSYGGFMTNWIITHTNRFAAAASQRSIANWISFMTTSDIGEEFTKDQQSGDIWQNHEKLWWHSPLRYVDSCKTPTLFIHSNEDYRCPYSEGLQMYSALCMHGIDTRLCMFKGENHELSRGGKPKHRIKRLEEITNWMNQHL